MMAAMPYALRGTSVVRSDTGRVVKTHPTREKAVAHLRALKANVEESAGGVVLGVLLEGFAAEKQDPASWKGRFTTGDHVRVKAKGAAESVTGRVVRPSDARPDTHVVLSTPGQPHVEASVGSVSLDTPERHARESAKRSAELQAQRPPVPGKADGQSPVRESVIGSLLEGFDPAERRGFHGRWIATFEHSVHGRITSPVAGRTSAEAWSAAEAKARGMSGGRVNVTVQSVVSHERPPAIHSDATRGRPSEGISDPKAVRSALHPVVARDLTGLGMGRWYAPPSGGGHVRRTEKGFEIYPHGSPQPVETHKTPSAAAAHAVRLGMPDSVAGSSRFAAGDHVTYQHGMFGKVAARVTKVTQDRVHVSSSDSRVRDTSMTHNQAAVRLEHMIGPHAPRPRLAKGQMANELRGGVPMREGLGVGELAESFSAAAAPGETAAQSMAIGNKQQAQAGADLKRLWNAAKHPRAKGGKFGYTTGGKRARQPRSSGGARTSVLTTGTHGALVKSIQAQLGIPADGVYGQRTRERVMSFQKAHGLVVDGIVGSQTLNALRGKTPGPPGRIPVTSARVSGSRSSRSTAATVKHAPLRFGGGTVV